MVGGNVSVKDPNILRVVAEVGKGVLLGAGIERVKTACVLRFAIVFELDPTVGPILLAVGVGVDEGALLEEVIAPFGVWLGDDVTTVEAPSILGDVTRVGEGVLLGGAVGLEKADCVV